MSEFTLGEPIVDVRMDKFKERLQFSTEELARSFGDIWRRYFVCDYTLDDQMETICSAQLVIKLDGTQHTVQLIQAPGSPDGGVATYILAKVGEDGQARRWLMAQSNGYNSIVTDGQGDTLNTPEANIGVAKLLKAIDLAYYNKLTGEVNEANPVPDLRDKKELLKLAGNPLAPLGIFRVTITSHWGDNGEKPLEKIYTDLSAVDSIRFAVKSFQAENNRSDIQGYVEVESATANRGWVRAKGPTKELFWAISGYDISNGAVQRIREADF